MHKLTAYVLIIICSGLLLLFGSTIIVLLPSMIKHGTIHELWQGDMIFSVMGMFMIITLSLFGLWDGIKRLRWKDVKYDAYTDDFLITVKGKINYADYRASTLGMYFTKPSYIFLMAMGLFYLFGTLGQGKGLYMDDGSYNWMIIFVGFVLISPLFVVVSVKKNFTSNMLFHEELQYTLTNDHLHIKGDTFESTQHWKRFHKIDETKQFIYLYQSIRIATLLDKSLFTEDELNEIRTFLKTLNIDYVK